MPLQDPPERRGRPDAAAAPAKDGAAPARGEPTLRSDEVLPFVEEQPAFEVRREASQAGWRDVLAWTLGTEPVRLDLPAFEDHHLIFHLSERTKLGLGFDGAEMQEHVLMTGAGSFVPAGVSNEVDIPGQNQSLHVILPQAALSEVAGEMEVTPHFRPFVGRLTPDLVSTAMLLHRELMEPRIGSAALAQALTQVLAVHVLRELAPPVASGRDRVWLLSERQVRQAISFMRANLREDLSLSDIAEAVGLSVYHFARSFRASVGSPPHQYLIQLRISRARELLATADLSLAQVAFETGFKSQSHFTYAFKRALRVTPREYRRISRQ